MLLRAGSIFALCACLVFGAFSHASEVIVHSSVTEKVLSKQRLRLIFSQRLTHWPDGQPIKVVVFDAASEEHQKFCEAKLGLLPFQLQRNWDRSIYSGRNSAPVFVSNAQQMIRAVSSTRGAIGYVPQSFMLEGEKEGVNVIE